MFKITKNQPTIDIFRKMHFNASKSKLNEPLQIIKYGLNNILSFNISGFWKCVTSWCGNVGMSSIGSFTLLLDNDKYPKCELMWLFYIYIFDVLYLKLPVERQSLWLWITIWNFMVNLFPILVNWARKIETYEALLKKYKQSIVL